MAATNRRQGRSGDLDRPGPVCPTPVKDISRHCRRIRLEAGRLNARARDYEHKRDEYLAVGVPRILDHRSFPAYHDGLPRTGVDAGWSSVEENPGLPD